MATGTRYFRALGLGLFVIGIVFGLGLAAIATWADVEAMFYGFEKMGDLPLKSYHCPLLITPARPEQVSERVSNTTDRAVQVTMRTDVSGPIIRTEQAQIALAPGERKTVDWDISWDDVSLGMFVLVKMSTFPFYQSSFRESSCGMVAVNLPLLSGDALADVLLVGALIGILAGLGVWEAANRPVQARPRQGTYFMMALGVTVLAALFFTFLGWWALAGLLVVLSTLVLIAGMYLVLG